MIEATPAEALSPAERQRLIQNIVIEHDRYREAIRGLEEFHRPVQGGLPSVGKINLLIGESRSGKTFATCRYAKRFPAKTGATGVIMPVVYVDMPPEGAGGIRAILVQLADALHVPCGQRTVNPVLMTSVLKALVDRQVEHLFLDEWDQIFRENDKRSQANGRGLLRKIANLGTLSVTCIGLQPTYRLMQIDEQIVGRGGLNHRVLRPYDWSSLDERNSFKLLCDEFDRMLPFANRSGLGRDGFAHRLFECTRGNVGKLKFMIEAAGALAINEHAARIELCHFADAYEHRKEPGARFNPFRDDLTMAPRGKTRVPEPTLKNGSLSQVFSKKPSANVQGSTRDV